MIAVAPTDLDWFKQLRDSQPAGEVNFWTPTPWNLKRLQPRDKFYFLLKSPIRKVGGYGVFKEYLNLSPERAWARFGKSNGVLNYDELVRRTEKYADKNAKSKLIDLV